MLLEAPPARITTTRSSPKGVSLWFNVEADLLFWLELMGWWDGFLIVFEGPLLSLHHLLDVVKRSLGGEAV
jgi:hypothetical protein